MRNIDDYSKIYSVQGFEDYQVAYRRRKVLEQIEYYKPQNVLEIGVGIDPIFKYVDDIRFTIVEPSDEFCENVRKISGDRVRCLHGFFEEIEGELEKEYDMIICSSLLHEVENPDKLLSAINEVCNKDTIVHINVPNANSMHRLLAYESGIIDDTHKMSQRNKILQQHNIFDLEGLTELVKKNGFNILNQGSYFVKPFTHEQMYNMLNSGVINEKILDGFYNIERYMPGLGSEIYVNCRIMLCQ